MKKRGRPASADQLTPTEWRVVEGVRHGMSNPALAKRLGVSLNAIKFHVSNALQKLQLDSRAALKLWNGVRRSSLIFERNTNMAELPRILGLAQVARQVSDIERSESWYRDVLGFKHLYRFGTMSFFDIGGVRLLLNAGMVSNSDSLLYFKVNNIHRTYEHLRLHAVVMISAPHLIHKHADGREEWMAFFKDLEDRPLGLLSVVDA
jgi:DNA-binding CsgD family transcriptional regulator/catechol 2,3-dioxygenase-like lactoylglutathione lyase family enzyme